ncbi:hypothetical protein QCA50_016939 [Cerrena zonata]|uniref:G protein-coupled receptor n=1 Tax=Cerrena zonata TaxID=2478898 RepID=A0AAW0FG67_9APHY
MLHSRPNALAKAYAPNRAIVLPQDCNHFSMLASKTLFRRYAPNDPETLLLPLLDIDYEDCMDPNPSVSSLLVGEQRIFIMATLVTCGSFVLQFIAGVVCLRMLWVSRHKSKSRMIPVLILHASAMELVNAVGLVTAILSIQWYFGPIQELIRKTCSPLGSDAGAGSPGLSESAGESSHWALRFYILEIVSNAAFGICGILSDAMLIWCCWKIWQLTLFPRPTLVIVIPTLLLLASTACLALTCAIGSFNFSISPTDYNDTFLFHLLIRSDFNFNAIYFILTLILNVVLTCLIILRLWMCKRRLQKVLGDGHGKHYSTLSIVFVESGSMNVVCSIMLLASLFGFHYYLSFDIWVALSPAVLACSNYSIIYRSSLGLYGSQSSRISTRNHCTVVFASPPTLTDTMSLSSTSP